MLREKYGLKCKIFIISKIFSRNRARKTSKVTFLGGKTFAKLIISLKEPKSTPENIFGGNVGSVQRKIWPK